MQRVSVKVRTPTGPAKPTKRHIDPRVSEDKVVFPTRVGHWECADIPTSLGGAMFDCASAVACKARRGPSCGIPATLSQSGLAC